MKARYNALNRSERRMAKEYVKQQAREEFAKAREQIDAQLSLHITVAEALMCIALNEKYGFGRKRLCRLIKQTEEQAASWQSWEDIMHEMLVKRLRQIKMDELADILVELWGKAEGKE